MALILDPVGSGLVASLANPGGNVTGLSMMTTVDLNSNAIASGTNPGTYPGCGYLESGSPASRQSDR
jgi:hypothetical protein